jgi:hypothetical protein
MFKNDFYSAPSEKQGSLEQRPSITHLLYRERHSSTNWHLNNFSFYVIIFLLETVS